MSDFPCLVRFVSGYGQVRDGLVDQYLEFLSAGPLPADVITTAFRQGRTVVAG